MLVYLINSLPVGLENGNISESYSNFHPIDNSVQNEELSETLARFSVREFECTADFLLVGPVGTVFGAIANLYTADLFS